MKSFRALPYSILIISPLFFAGCGPVAKENENNTSASFVSSIASEKYAIDKKESVVTWKGSMALAGKGQHIGYAYLSAGELMLAKGQLVGGSVEVDMNTITDPVHGSENNLIRHLKSSDFFDVEKFPISAFVITVAPFVSGENINVTGNLTMKGITHAITFPAKIEVKNGVVTANGKLIIDRTTWDVRYKSGKFFDILADEVISDDIEFDMRIVAKKSSPTKILKTAVHPTTTKDVKPAATNIFLQSKDGGQTWQDISQSLPKNEQSGGFFVGESDLYLHVKNELYRSKSNLKTPVWEKEVTDLKSISASAWPPLRLLSIVPESWPSTHSMRSIFESSDGTIFFGYDRGLYKSIDKGKNWKKILDQGGGDMVESEGVLLATGRSGIMRSTDKGEHWEWVISEGGVGIDVERIEGGFAAISYNNITKSRRIRISLDRGKTWQAIDEELQPSMSISSIKQVGNYLICGHPNGIFRSSDMGKTWNMVHPGVDKNRVFTIYVSGNIVYAVAGSGGC